jgi:alpha-L-rhamnosidase
MNSFNHYAYGAVCEWIWETVAGISADPRQPGFRHIIMRPVPDKRLGSISAEYKSAAGLIKSGTSTPSSLMLSMSSYIAASFTTLNG